MFRSSLLVLALAGVAAAQQTTSYVLAGQSNIAYWGDAIDATNCSLRRPNVVYVDFMLTPRVCAAPALMELGARLGDANPSRNVRIYQCALGGSSVSDTAFILAALAGWSPTGFWFPNNSAFFPLALPVQQLARLMDAGANANEVRIIWCQGENEMLFPYGTTPYLTDAVNALDLIRAGTGKGSTEVMLITPGVLEYPGIAASSNPIRDAFMQLPAATAGTATPARTVAHHYDLPLAAGDPVHHSLVGYQEMARRTADGINDATRVLDWDGSFSLAANRTQLKLGLTATSATAADPRFFSITPAGTVAVSGSSLTITFSTALPPSTRVTVRHVPGSGDGLNWTAAPPLQVVPPAPAVPFVCAPFVFLQVL